MQALGYHMAITPRFFNFPYVQLSTGNTVEQCTYYPDIGSMANLCRRILLAPVHGQVQNRNEAD
jgi:hypothetical protein